MVLIHFSDELFRPSIKQSEVFFLIWRGQLEKERKPVILISSMGGTRGGSRML